MLRALILAAMVLGGGSMARADPARPPTVEAILDGSVRAYRAMTTYRDTGTIQTGDAQSPALRFTTAYGSPSWLAYRVENPGDGGVWQAWVTRDHTLRRRNLIAPVVDLGAGQGLALFASARATNASADASAFVPTLLLGDARALELPTLALVGRESVRAHPCWHLADAHLELWIASDTLLIQRIAWRREVKSAAGTAGVVERVVYDYEPERDPILDPTVELAPPN